MCTVDYISYDPRTHAGQVPTLPVQVLKRPSEMCPSQDVHINGEDINMDMFSPTQGHGYDNSKINERGILAQ